MHEQRQQRKKPIDKVVYGAILGLPIGLPIGSMMGNIGAGLALCVILGGCMGYILKLVNR